MSRQRETFSEINITPLTDIFLVLLIIMMVIAPMLDQQGLNLAVPDMIEVQEIKDSKMLDVIVTNDDKVIIDGNEVPETQLENIIKEKSQELKDGLLIQTEPDSTHGTVVKVMDKARNVGVANISVSELAE